MRFAAFFGLRARFRTPLRSMLPILLLLLGLVAAAPAVRALPDGPYKLGPGDILQIVLVELPEMGGPFLIGDDGMVSLPGLGAIRASGLSVRQFEQDLRRMIEAKISDPSVAVQIVEYRPFYILGDVREPGSYPYVPGLRVIQAITLASGFGKDARDGNAFGRRLENMRARQAAERYALELAGLKIRLARLEAEQAERADFSVDLAGMDLPGKEAPGGAPGGDAGTQARLRGIIAAEKLLFAASREGYGKTIELSRRTLEARQAETESYASRLAVSDEYLAAIRKELENVRGLRERGLVPVSRLNDMERNEISARGQALQTSSLMRQAQVATSSAEQELHGYIAGRRLELAQSIRTVRAQIADTGARLASERRIIAATSEPGISGNGASCYRFRLLRDDAWLPDEIGLNSRMRADDTLLVIRDDAAGCGG